MLKNLRVRTKIFLGFAIVILALLIVTVVVAVSSLGNIGNVNDIEAVVKFNVQSNTMLDNFNNARAAASVLSNVESDQMYTEFAGEIDKAKAEASALSRLVNENSILKEYSDEISEIQSALDTYDSAIDSVQSGREQQTAIYADNAAKGAKMTDSFHEMYGVEAKRLEALAGGEVSGGSVGEAIRIGIATAAAADLEMELSSLRRQVVPLLNKGDVTGVGEIREKWIEFEKRVSERIEESAGSTRDMLTEAHGDLLAYLQNMDTFYALIQQIHADTASADSARTKLMSVLTGLLEQLDNAAFKSIDTAKQSSTVSFIIILIIAIAAIAIGVIFAIIVSRGISKPLGQMAQAAKKLAVGDLDIAVNIDTKDEIGELAVTMGEVVGTMSNQAAILNSIASRDLSVNPVPLSEKDVVGHSLVTLVDKLNEVFAEINQASRMVSGGSEQVAQDSQHLAEGATSQAAAVEELSSNIGEVSSHTAQNAEMANKASSLAQSIMAIAETGSRHMDDMMKSVLEINEASASISKVIKVIDDLAFQTNILALNAAVEASRAGQFGKGFAVVAEEVRSLAAKSADAARDTGLLISNSMEKSELGTRIAKDTAASLKKIVDGINESSQIVMEISNLSSGQASAIRQIESGIEQVSDVVQANAATAEESASASRDLSAQAVLLANVIGQFKLKGNLNSRSEMAPSAHAQRPAPTQQLTLAEAPYDENGYGKY